MREYQAIPRAYELMVLINPETNDEALTNEIDQITKIVADTGAEIALVKRDAPWGRRRLAYQISRFRDATYVLYQFKTVASRVRDIERELKLNERVIRYLVVRLDELPPQEPEAPEPETAADATAETGSDEPQPVETEATEESETVESEVEPAEVTEPVA